MRSPSDPVPRNADVHKQTASVSATEAFFRTVGLKRVAPLLPTSVEPYPKENFESYLYRLAECNGVPYISEVMHALQIPPRKTFTLGEHTNICLRLDHRLRELVPVEPVANAGKARFAGQWIRSKHLTFTTRLCPECLIEDGYGRIGWNLLPLPVCDRHGVYLVDRCPCSPNRAISLRRNRYWECECGTDLRSVVPRQASDMSRLLARAVITRLLYPSYDDAMDSLRGLLSIPRTISCTELLDIIVVLGCMDPKTGKLGPRYGSPSSDLQPNIERFERAARILAAWPESLLPSIRVVIAPTAHGSLSWADPSDRHDATRRYLDPTLFNWIKAAQLELLQKNIGWMLQSLRAEMLEGKTCTH